jgi:hypothetical protein
MPDADKDVWVVGKKALAFIASSPDLAVPFFFMWLSGCMLSFLTLGPQSKFVKRQKPTKLFNLVMGFLPCAAVMILHHGVQHWCQHRVFSMPSTLDDLRASALPSSLILASLTFGTFVYKAFR